MKKMIFAVIISAFTFMACQTPPPQWWDPRGTYTGTGIANGTDYTNTDSKTTSTKTTAVREDDSAVVGVRQAEPSPDYQDSFVPIEEPEIESVELPIPSVLN